RSLIVLRIVAGETPRPNRREIVRDPAGSAVSTYDRITASRIWRSRSVSSGFFDAISPSLLMASERGQGGGEAVEPQPSLRGQRHPVLSQDSPPGLLPVADHLRVARPDRKTVHRAQAEIDLLRQNVLHGELLG